MDFRKPSIFDLVSSRGDMFPPVLQLLVSEKLHETKSAQDLESKLKRDRGLLKDLRAQARYSARNWKYVDRAPSIAGDFSVIPAPSLDPFALSPFNCPSPACRARTGRMLARSIGLYADRIVVPDGITAILHGDPPLRMLAQALFADLTAFREIRPLLESGVVRFGLPPHGFCEKCDAVMNGAAGAALDTIFDMALDAGVILTISPTSNGSFVNVGLSDDFAGVGFGPLLTEQEVEPFTRALTRGDQTEIVKMVRDTESLRRSVSSLLRGSLFPLADAMRSAGRTGSALTAGRRAESDFLRAVELRTGSIRESPDWGLLGAVQLPWVSDLSVAQILELKDQARHALPALRNLLARKLSGSEPSNAPTEALVEELREEAIRVEAELGAWQRARGQAFHLALGGLGLSFVLYGLAVARDVGTTALGTFLTALASAHPAAQKERLATEKLKTQPGYVLLRAKNLLGHAD